MLGQKLAKTCRKNTKSNRNNEVDIANNIRSRIMCWGYESTQLVESQLHNKVILQRNKPPGKTSNELAAVVALT